MQPISLSAQAEVNLTHGYFVKYSHSTKAIKLDALAFIHENLSYVGLQ